MTANPTRRQFTKLALHGFAASFCTTALLGGRAFLSDGERLRRVLVMLGLISMPAAASMSQRELQRIVAEQIQRDFLRNDSVAVDGWILSRTEARLYALIPN